MSSRTVSDCKKPNPLQDDDLSELTKKEILFWARKLQLSPSELFTLTRDELECHLERAQQEEFYDEIRKNQYAKWERLSEMKRFLLEEQHRERLKGGGRGGVVQNRTRTLWQILCTAANEIESMYANSSQEFSNEGCGGSGAFDSCPISNSVASSYQNSSFGGFPTPPVPNMCSTIYEMHPDDSQYTPPEFPSSFPTTPINCALAPRPANFTYNVGSANATYNVCKPRNISTAKKLSCAPQNATYSVRSPRNTNCSTQRAPNVTYNVCPVDNRTYDVARAVNATFHLGQQPPNTTYNVPSYPENATYNARPSLATNATYSMCRPNATYNISGPNATFDIPQKDNRTFDIGPARGRSNVTFNVCPRSANATPASPKFCPNPVMASTPKNCPRTGRPPYFRNYTDYWLTLSGLGITEASQSVSYDIFGDNKSMVRAAARTYSIPHRSKSCPPIGRSQQRSQLGISSGSSIQCPRGVSSSPSPMRYSTPVQAIAAAKYGFSAVARPAAERSFDGPRRLYQGNTCAEFCDCARRSRSMPSR
ncbi:unnamed protein product [Ceratitis capitata]|uniref:(Mediterranean fruit fly) hypothetical protein n=1 Tax=Ceratitis capitata TaxID=7213 RepID=A0A811V2I7_CERCA|nr:unnamed protein product [Ceratitis capitata]